MPRYALLYLSLTLLAVRMFYGASHHTPRNGRTDRPKRNVVDASVHDAEVARLADDLQSGNPNQVEGALSALQAALSWDELSPAAATQLVRLSAHSSLSADAVRDVMQVVQRHAAVVDPNVLDGVLPQQSATGRLYSLQVLSGSNSMQASKMLARLLQSGLSDDERTSVMVGLTDRPHHPAILLPAVLAANGSPESRLHRAAVLGEYGRALLLPTHLLEPHRTELVNEYRGVLGQIAAYRPANGANALQSRDYLDLRLHAKSLLLAFAYLPNEWSAAEVGEALEHPDADIALHAAWAELAHKRQPPAATLARIATDPASRSALTRMLEHFDRLDLLPPA